MSKTIVVFGATGQQGGSVITALLADSQLSKEYKIVGITRDTSKAAAQALAKQGVKLASADISDKASVLSAVKGADAVFFLTNYWETKSRDTEVQQGKNVADASKEAGVKHIIFSSLVNVTKISGGKLPHVPHFDGKNDVEQHIRSLGFETASFIYPGFYMQNLVGSMLRKGDDDGVYTFAVPVGGSAQYPLVDIVADFGRFAIPVLKLPRDTADGLIVYAAGGYYTPTEIVEAFSRATGKEARYVQVPADVWKGFLPEEIAQEMLENMLLLEGPGYYGGAGLESSLALVEGKPTSLEAFARRQKEWNE